MPKTFEIVSTAGDLRLQLFVGTRQQCVSKLADLLETAYSRNRIVTRLPNSGNKRCRHNINARRPNDASYTLHVQPNH